MVEQLQEDVNNLKEADIMITGSHAEIVRLRQFIQRKLKFDQTVVCILSELQDKFTIFAKSDDNLRRVMDEWAPKSESGNDMNRKSVSPSFSFVSYSFEHLKYIEYNLLIFILC